MKTLFTLTTGMFIGMIGAIVAGIHINRKNTEISLQILKGFESPSLEEEFRLLDQQ